jgi:microcystin-dependent protein
MEGTLAVVTPVAYNFTPRYWLPCNGQLLNISTNSALFSLLGTTYGGNGMQTFGLPDLRGRVAVGTGNGPSSSVSLGEVGGTENVTLSLANIPPHNHNGPITITPRVGATAETADAADNNLGQATNGYANTPTPNTFVQGPNVVSSTVGMAGSSMPFEILTPYITVNYVICTQGVYPSRN